MRYKAYFMYIAASRTRVLYVGVTHDLERRMAQHRLGTGGGFTTRYAVHKLVYFETARDVHSAMEREKQVKRWGRLKKIALIEKENGEWVDLLPPR
jgi:putative endonuclease